MAAITLSRRLAAEGLGTALLLAVEVGSGIMGERRASGNAAIVLLAHALATGGGLGVLILILEPVSGAHFNPAVTLADAWQKRLPWREVPGYWLAQLAGAFLGVAVSHAMFGLPAWFSSTHIRTGGSLWFSEFVATFGLLASIAGSRRWRPEVAPLAVGVYIAIASWSTASSAFANPAVTLARTATDTFTGIRLADAPSFMAAQLLGAMAGAITFRWLLGTEHD